MTEGLTPTQKGDIIEHLIGDLIVITGKGALTTYLPVSDLEGVDLIVNQRYGFNPLYIQVKGRFVLRKGNHIYLDIRKSTIRAHPRSYCIFAYFDKKNMELYDYLWLIPSKEIVKLKTHLVKGKPCYRFVGSINPESKDRWSKYKVRKNELGIKLGELLSKLMYMDEK